MARTDVVRTQVSLDPQMYEEARAEARRRGISLAQLYREALQLILGRQDSQDSTASVAEQPWMKFAGSIAMDNGEDASSSVDEVVYGRERP